MTVWVYGVWDYVRMTVWGMGLYVYEYTHIH